MSPRQIAFVLLTAAACLGAAAPAQAIGDQPYWPGWYNWEPGIQSGCWKWNWQQFSWYDCKVLPPPRAYLYHRSSAVVPAKG